jgi:adenine/guanine phosphoribosyltransferase-like PRPP-binding protein
MIKKLKVNVIIVTKRNSLLTNQDIERYNSQYNNLKVVYSDDYHDRYFIIDKKDVYHSGTSINHAGSRTFSINKWEDKQVCNSFINNIQNIL